MNTTTQIPSTETPPQFRTGQRVLDKFGTAHTVIFQQNTLQVYVGPNTWIHPANLRVIQ